MLEIDQAGLSRPLRLARVTRRIFLSSTLMDLRLHREKIIETLGRMDQGSIAMEFFGARGQGDATTVSLDELATCDAYLLIVAWRYGYVPPNQSLSVTHAEYEEAKRLGVPCFIFLADPSTLSPSGDDALFPASTRDPDHWDQLTRFRDELGLAVVDFFTTPDDLASKVAPAIHRYLQGELAKELVRGGRRHPRDLPPRAPGLVGRSEEVRILEARLTDESVSSRAAAIWGMPGVGKSALAAEVMHTLANKPDTFTGGATWVRCDGQTGETGLVWVLGQLVMAWGGEVRAEQLIRLNFAEQANLLYRALVDLLPANVLILLDNIEPGFPIDGALASLLARGAAVLVTSRQLISSSYPRIVKVDVLDQSAALRLFKERYADQGGILEPSGQDDDVAVVVEKLGRLPLAIELAAARAALMGTGIRELASELAADDVLGLLGDPLNPEKNVQYAFSKSLATLREPQRLSFAAFGQLDGLDWPRPVIEQLFSQLIANESDTRAPGAMLNGLVAFALATLVTPDAAPAGGSIQPPSRNAVSTARVRLHPLLRQLAKEEWASLPSETKRHAIAALVRSLSEYVRLHRRDFPALARDEQMVVGALQSADALHLESRQSVAIVDRLWAYIHVAGHPRLGLDLYTLQSAACRDLGDRRGEGAALSNLGDLADDLGQKDEATSYFQRALAIQREIGDQFGEAATLHNLGSFMRKQGKRGEAETYYRQALEIRRQIGDRRGEGATLSSIAQMADDPVEAMRDLQVVLVIFREVRDRPSEGVVLSYLGSAAERQGDLPQAERYYIDALAIHREVGNGPSEASVLVSLGRIAALNGFADQARKHYQDAIARFEALGDYAGAEVSRVLLAQLTTSSPASPSAQTRGDSSPPAPVVGFPVAPSGPTAPDPYSFPTPGVPSSPMGPYGPGMPPSSQPLRPYPTDMPYPFDSSTSPGELRPAEPVGKPVRIKRRWLPWRR